MTISNTFNPLIVHNYRNIDPIHQDKILARIIACWLGTLLIVLTAKVFTPFYYVATSALFICAKPLYRGIQTTRLYKSIFLRQSDNPLKESVIAESYQLRGEIAHLEAKIKLLKQFVQERPDLMGVINDNLKNYGKYIAYEPSGVTIIPEGPDDWIGQHGSLRLRVNGLEHLFNEQIRFINSHKAVRDCFKNTLQHAKGSSQNDSDNFK